eukprot:256886-Pleurochrysis_carterae.AAC.1
MLASSRTRDAGRRHAARRRIAKPIPMHEGIPGARRSDEQPFMEKHQPRRRARPHGAGRCSPLPCAFPCSARVRNLARAAATRPERPSGGARETGGSAVAQRAVLLNTGA